MTTQTQKRAVSLMVVSLLMLVLFGGILYQQVDGTDLSNPRANFWRAVREGVPGFTKVSMPEHQVLILNSGENWRSIRNGLLMPYSQWLLFLAVAGVVLVYRFTGGDKLESPRSGIMIERYSYKERLLHWYTAVIFILMALTGLSLLLARLFIMPVFGHTLVSWGLQTAKVVHNFCGPLLLIGIFLELIRWFRLNIPKKVDLLWFKNMGGMIGHGPRPHSEKVNGGQKAWFWLVVVFGIIVGSTGVILDFPIWGQTRFTMQVSHVIHVVAAIPFVAASLGHIYMGSIGSEGVLEGMLKGSVDAVWAKQHSDLWYEEMTQQQGNREG